jgi:chromosome segregation ATPase
MNAHVHGVVFKERLNARQPEPPPKGQRRPLGLAPVIEEVSTPSALDGRTADELASPATVQHVLEALDAAVSIRTEIENPLKVRIARLESSNDELKGELAAATAAIATSTAAIATLTAAQEDARTAVNRLQISNEKLRRSLEWTRDLALKTRLRLAKDHPAKKDAAS